MSVSRSHAKSGQAIIFVMVVLVIGLLVVIWNFDLHRVISAKLRMRNAADSAALAAARWQGMTLNMIGDLNLIQSAMLSGNSGSGSSVEDIHELRARLNFVGPLAAFSVAQQTAFNNGAFHDEELAENLLEQAELIREEIGFSPYANARDEYADLLESLAQSGVAVSSYPLLLPKHPLVEKGFYAAVGQALAGWWCPFRKGPFNALLENYQGYLSWDKLDTEFKLGFMLDLRLEEFVSVSPKPDSALATDDEFSAFIVDQDFNVGDTVAWHVYDLSWPKKWKRAAEYESDGFPIRANVRHEYNYMGADAPIAISTPVSRGILSTSDHETLELGFKAKAKPLGYLAAEDGLVPPCYFGFVFPAFRSVRLIHSDIGTPTYDAAFYRHVTEHLENYLDRGPSAVDQDCPYCRLLVKWEQLDHAAGLRWIEAAEADPDNDPCEAEASDRAPWGDDGGGFSGGS